MAIVIDEVDVSVAEPPRERTGSAPREERPPGLDANAVLLLLRREQSRLARLWTD